MTPVEMRVISSIARNTQDVPILVRLFQQGGFPEVAANGLLHGRRLTPPATTGSWEPVTVATDDGFY
jgi:hypothetical protein